MLLAGGALRLYMNVIVYYRYVYMIGLSATSQEMLSTAQGAINPIICVVLQVYPKAPKFVTHV